MLIIKIWLTFLKIGLFSFGGGYAMIPFIEKEIINIEGWMSLDNFVDIIAIAEITPGPIAINSATFVGFQLNGFWGSLLATAGVVFLPVILALIVARYFIRFRESREVKAVLQALRPMVLGLITTAVITVGQNSFIDWKSVVIALMVLFLLVRVRLNPVAVIILSGVLGIVLYGV